MSLQKYVHQMRVRKVLDNKSQFSEAYDIIPKSSGEIDSLDIPHDKVNVHGGACAQGHPVGSTGSRLLVTLMHSLKHYGKKKGVAALCIGGGEATAMAIEVL